MFLQQQTHGVRSTNESTSAKYLQWFLDKKEKMSNDISEVELSKVLPTNWWEKNLITTTGWLKKKTPFLHLPDVKFALYNFYTNVNPLDLDQSTAFFSCSSVKKMRIVVGCRRVQAGTQPLNMNIGPSFFIDERMTAMVDFLFWLYIEHKEGKALE